MPFNFYKTVFLIKITLYRLKTPSNKASFYFHRYYNNKINIISCFLSKLNNNYSITV
ncbi:hypothetical protein EC2845650_4115 [Escherichia coli 2845650]|nr:hypothetical protein EC2845650_4115 [Escherichia coli 2845650]